MRALLFSFAAIGLSATSSPASPSTWWIRPLDRALLQLAARSDDARPFATPARPRDVTGAITMTCERREGRPCGDGVGGFVELDGIAGYGDALSIGARLRAVAGTDAYAPALAVDRAVVRSWLGPVRATAGRDVLAIGPTARTALAWGAHPAPIDHVQLATARPVALSRALGASAGWTIGRLGPPQTFDGNLVTIVRGQLDVGAVSLGATQLLQLGGTGAPALGVWGFLREHVTRGDASASGTDSSNRRVGFDVAAPIAGARAYYAIMFEDWRARVHDAVRYDADHLLGAEVPIAGNALVLELSSTGVRSHEHVPRTTGFTHRGRVVGNPLGPDATAVFVGARLPHGRFVVEPWVELARLSSDRYTFVTDGPILHAARGPAEQRYRIGAKAIAPIGRELRVELEAMLERTTNFAFVPGQRRTNAGVVATIVWSPPWTLGTLGR